MLNSKPKTIGKKCPKKSYLKTSKITAFLRITFLCTFFLDFVFGFGVSLKLTYLREQKFYFVENQNIRAGHSLFFSRFALRSIFMHGSLLLYRSYCWFSGSLIAQLLSKRPVVRSWKRALKRSIALETTAIRSITYVSYLQSINHRRRYSTERGIVHCVLEPAILL